MYARVATFEGGDADSIRGMAENMRSRAASGPPEGVESVGFTMLIDPEGGRVLLIGLFETEEKLKTSDAVLNDMPIPPTGSPGKRTSVDMYEVAVDIRL